MNEWGGLIGYNRLISRGYRVEILQDLARYRVFGRIYRHDELRELAQKVCWTTSPEVQDEIDKRMK